MPFAPAGSIQIVSKGWTELKLNSANRKGNGEYHSELQTLDTVEKTTVRLARQAVEANRQDLHSIL